MQDTNHLSHDPTQSGVAKIIDWSVHNQLLVIVGVVALIIAGLLAVKTTPLDAIPDLSDTQVIIRTDFPGQSPQIVEDLVTYPLSTTMLGLPKTKDVRGFSMFGTSFVRAPGRTAPACLQDPQACRHPALPALSPRQRRRHARHSCARD